jgi:hypothetical protein
MGAVFIATNAKGSVCRDSDPIFLAEVLFAFGYSITVGCNYQSHFFRGLLHPVLDGRGLRRGQP